MIKKLFKIIKVFFLVLSTGVITYLLAAVILSVIPYPAEDNNGKKGIDIYIMTNGIHTDIVMPVKTDIFDWNEIFRLSNTVSKDSTQNFIGIGWGSRDFYMNVPEWSDITFKLALTSTVGIGSSALHVTYYKSIFENKDCVNINITHDEYKRLIDYILASVKTDRIGKSMVVNTNTRYGLTDNFYEANGRYSLLNTCNTWANDALKACGQKAAIWTPFQEGVFLHYK